MIQQHPLDQRQRGFSLVELMIVISIIGILIAIGIPAWQSSVRSTNEAAAISHLQRIATQQVAYFNSKNRSGYGTFDQLVQGGYLDDRFKGDAPVVDGYVFEMTLTPRSGSQPAEFHVNANPQKATGLTATGSQYFYLGSDSGTVRVNTEKPATAEDPAIGGGSGGGEGAK
jgi:prepilin-type N-terminal cleavage/methylation domain-containing protein